MNLILNRLIIENFKGIKRAEYSFSDITRIRGRNASGKSSIVDAFCWLLFNKNSHGNAPGSDEFHEKPLDADGNEVHHLDTMVEAHFTLDGQQFNLRRVQRENWVKSRGSMDAQYKGNASYYWINDVETKAKDFKDRIDGIVGGEVFMLISALGAFNKLSDEKRRAILLSMCGIDVDTELLSRAEFSDIAEEASTLNVKPDDLRKVFAERKRRINQELTTIPARIDEATRSKPDFTDVEMSDAQYSLNDAKKDLEACQRALARLEGGEDTTAELRRHILMLETEIVHEKNRIRDDHEFMRRSLGQNVDSAKNRLLAAQSRQGAAEESLRLAENLVEKAKIKVDELRSQYRARFSDPCAVPDMPDVCPTCGQAIPQQQREKALADIKSKLEKSKKDDLAAIRRDGQNAAIELEKLSASLKEKSDAAKEARSGTMSAQEELTKAEDALRVAPMAPDFSTQRIKELEAELHDAKQRDYMSPDKRIAAAKDRIADLQARIDRANATLAKRGIAQKMDARIAELKEQQASYGKKMADLEVKLFDLERFIAERCKLLEESINSLFPTVRWKLFNRQINGALVDCCECMMLSGASLVSYSGNNTASCVNADIEIIGVLQKHYGITAPVFVDNAERVNEISIPSGQLITLSVSSDDELTFEHTAMKEAA